MEPSPQISATRSLGRHGFRFAFRPDRAARDAAVRIQSELLNRSDECAPIRPDNLHVLLFPLWEGEKVSADLIEIATTLVLAIDGKPFEFKFDKLASVPRQNGFSTVLAASHTPGELYALQRKFVSRFEGLSKAGDLTPCLALLDTDRVIESKPIEPVRWVAREFLLLHTFLGEARQEIVGRWPLR